MPTKTKYPTTATETAYEAEVPGPIIVERRVRVAEIHGGGGDHPPLRAAFMAVSDFLAEHYEDPHDRLTFDFAGATFTIMKSPEGEYRS